MKPYLGWLFLVKVAPPGFFASKLRIQTFQENAPHKPYAFQGSVIIGEHMDISEMAIRSAPVGAGDVGERKRRRVMLKGIPLSTVRSVQPVTGQKPGRWQIWGKTLKLQDQTFVSWPAELLYTRNIYIYTPIYIYIFTYIKIIK